MSFCDADVRVLSRLHLLNVGCPMLPACLAAPGKLQFSGLRHCVQQEWSGCCNWRRRDGDGHGMTMLLGIINCAWLRIPAAPCHQTDGFLSPKISWDVGMFTIWWFRWPIHSGAEVFAGRLRQPQPPKKRRQVNQLGSQDPAFFGGLSFGWGDHMRFNHYN